MQFGASMGFAFHQVEALAATQLCTIWDASSQFGDRNCLPRKSQPEPIIILQFHSVLDECQINWQEGKTLC